MKILALDPATKCGWAHSGWGPHGATSGTWDLSIRRDESGGMRLIRLQSKLNAIAGAGLDLVVFEAARNAGPKMQGALVVQSELQGVIKVWCEEKGIDYRGYSPSEIKKFATGKGNANKPEMLAAANAEWPDVEIIDDNQADAMWLLALVQSELGGEA